MILRFVLTVTVSASLVAAQGFGLGCYNPARRQCSCTPDECNKEKCESQPGGRIWIEPSPDADPFQPSGGCGTSTRCTDEQLCLEDDPTTAPVPQFTIAPVPPKTAVPVASPTQAPVNPADRAGCVAGGRCNGDLYCCDCDTISLNDCFGEGKLWNVDCGSAGLCLPPPDVPVPTSPPVAPRSGCISGGRCNGKQFCCDCDITEEACTELGKFWIEDACPAAWCDVPGNPTVAPVAPPTDAPVEPTDAPVEPTEAPIEFGLGCYNPGIRRCGCGPDECRKDLCEAKGFFWIEPSPDADPFQPAAGCSLESRCQDDDLCPLEPTDAPVEPTDAPVDPTDAPVEPTDAPVEPTEAPIEFGLGCYNPGIRRCGCGPDECRKDLCEAKGFFWIEPSPDADPFQPAAGCSLESRCQDDDLCPLEPTDAPVEPTDAPVEPTEAPIEFGIGCYNPAVRRCSCGPDVCNPELCIGAGFSWIAPSPNPDPFQPAIGCSLQTRCQEGEFCPVPTDAPVEPTDAPVEPTDAPVAPTDAPVAPTDSPVDIVCEDSKEKIPGQKKKVNKCRKINTAKEIADECPKPVIASACPVTCNIGGCGSEPGDECSQFSCKQCFGSKANKKKCSVYVAPGATTSTCISRDTCDSLPGTCYKRIQVPKPKGKESTKACNNIEDGLPPFPGFTIAPVDPKTAAPTAAPTNAPTAAPTAAPTVAPTPAPTNAPTNAPTEAPTVATTGTGTTEFPTPSPSESFTLAPTLPFPTASPTDSPTSPGTDRPDIDCVDSTDKIPDQPGSVNKCKKIDTPQKVENQCAKRTVKLACPVLCEAYGCTASNDDSGGGTDDD